MTQPIQLPQAGQQKTPLQVKDAAFAPVRFLYIHVPFCTHKCHYCDFYSVEIEDHERHKAFVDALIVELARLGAWKRAVDQRSEHTETRLQSIFIGGGTPSLLAPSLWRELLEVLRSSFDCSLIDAGSGEFTVECNPESASDALFETLVAGGVNRISAGAQSFNPMHLKALERLHQPENVQRTMALAASAGIHRRSVDLIFGIPGQTIEDALDDVDKALELTPAVEHLSCYALTYEPNTPMTARMRRGEFAPMDESLERDMMEGIAERLAHAGFDRYEISNFAKATREPGAAQSLHNLAYWRNESWLAAGPSASGHLRVHPADTAAGGWRYKNNPRLSDWSRSVLESDGYASVQDVEPPDAARALVERLLMGLRLAEGVDAKSCLQHAEAIGAADALDSGVHKQIDDGMMTLTEGRWRMTDEGVYLLDGIVGELTDPIA